MSILDEDFDERIDWAMQRIATIQFMFPKYDRNNPYQHHISMQLASLVAETDYHLQAGDDYRFAVNSFGKEISDYLTASLLPSMNNACILQVMKGSITQANVLEYRHETFEKAAEMFGVPEHTIHNARHHKFDQAEIFTVEMYVGMRKALVDCIFIESVITNSHDICCLLKTGPQELSTNDLYRINVNSCREDYIYL